MVETSNSWIYPLTFPWIFYQVTGGWRCNGVREPWIYTLVWAGIHYFLHSLSCLQHSRKSPYGYNSLLTEIGVLFCFLSRKQQSLCRFAPRMGLVLAACREWCPGGCSFTISWDDCTPGLCMGYERSWCFSEFATYSSDVRVNTDESHLELEFCCLGFFSFLSESLRKPGTGLGICVSPLQI